MVDRDVNCRPLDWKYDNFPVQEMALDPEEFGPISLEESDSWLLQPQRLCEANLLDKLVTLYTGNKPKQDCSLLQAAIKDLI